MATLSGTTDPDIAMQALDRKDTTQLEVGDFGGECFFQNGQCLIIKIFLQYDYMLFKMEKTQLIQCYMIFSYIYICVCVCVMLESEFHMGMSFCQDSVHLQM